MPALTHGRIKNGFNGPIRNNKPNKKYRHSMNTPIKKVNPVLGGVGASNSVKLAWKRRAPLQKKLKCCD